MDRFEIDEDIGMNRRSPAASGLVSYELGETIPATFAMRDASTYQPAKLLARIENEHPKPVALHLRASVAGSTFDFDGMAQQPTLAVAGTPGLVLIIDYGDLSGRHRLVADLRSGTYQLPAVTFAQVSVLFWDPGGSATFGFQAAAACSNCILSSPKYLTYTAAGDMIAAATALIEIPYYAQFVDCWANGWATGIGGVGAPILRAPEVGLYRDYTTGLFVPSWGPISLSGDSLDTDVLTLENAGPATVRAFVQFYLVP